jgi:hypothetical protein
MPAPAFWGAKAALASPCNPLYRDEVRKSSFVLQSLKVDVVLVVGDERLYSQLSSELRKQKGEAGLGLACGQVGARAGQGRGGGQGLRQSDGLDDDSPQGFRLLSPGRVKRCWARVLREQRHLLELHLLCAR